MRSIRVECGNSARVGMRHRITSLTLSLNKFRVPVFKFGWDRVMGPLAVSRGGGGAGGECAQPQAPEQGSRSHAAQSCDITDAALRTTTRHSFPSWTGPAGLRPELRPRMHRPYRAQNWPPQIMFGRETYRSSNSLIVIFSFHEIGNFTQPTIHQVLR